MDKYWYIKESRNSAQKKSDTVATNAIKDKSQKIETKVGKQS